MPTRLHTTQLGESEIASLSHHSASQCRAVDPDGVIRLVPGIRLCLRLRLDVGADPAVPQQVNGGGEDAPDEFSRGEGIDLGRDAQTGTHLGCQRNGLSVARKNPAARRQRCPVVIDPGGAGQVVEALPLGKGDGGIRIGVQEDVPMIECRHETDVG